MFKDEMSLFNEYLKLTPAQLGEIDVLRRAQLARIARIRDSEVVAYAVKMTMVPGGIDVTLNTDDILPISDLLGGMNGKRITMLLETPGGSGEVAKHIVEQLHDQFEHVTFIVPGTAMSAGTIMCLGGNEIMMGPGSALGPIDAQLQVDGKRFSADAFLAGFQAIKDEVTNKKELNAAYIPMLQRISPGELQNAHNALNFASTTVAEWLCRWKFSNWEKGGVPVTPVAKKARAEEIAKELTRQSKWFSHGHSIRIPALIDLGLAIDDFSKHAELNDAVLRYQILLRMTLQTKPVYKIYETASQTVALMFSVPGVNTEQRLDVAMENAASLQVNVNCSQCHAVIVYQLDFLPGQRLQPGSARFPNQPMEPCPRCRAPLTIGKVRAEIEAKLGRKALEPQPTI